MICTQYPYDFYYRFHKSSRNAPNLIHIRKLFVSSTFPNMLKTKYGLTWMKADVTLFVVVIVLARELVEPVWARNMFKVPRKVGPLHG